MRELPAGGSCLRMVTTRDLLDLEGFEHAEAFEGCEHPWEALRRLHRYIAEVVGDLAVHARLRGEVDERAVIGDGVIIGDGTIVEAGAVIKGPTVIGRGCQVRANCYIRGNVISGNDCVLGNGCEFKHCILMDECQVPHLSYVGDSVLGRRAHLGAGVIVSNLKSLRREGETVKISAEGRELDTGLGKFGAVLGDGAEVGCSCVLNPGSVIGRNSVIYPGVVWRGACPANSVVKLRQEWVVVGRKM